MTSKVWEGLCGDHGGSGSGGGAVDCCGLKSGKKMGLRSYGGSYSVWYERIR